jgi:hypothetical protein
VHVDSRGRGRLQRQQRGANQYFLYFDLKFTWKILRKIERGEGRAWTSQTETHGQTHDCLRRRWASLRWYHGAALPRARIQRGSTPAKASQVQQQALERRWYEGLQKKHTCARSLLFREIQRAAVRFTGRCMQRRSLAPEEHRRRAGAAVTPMHRMSRPNPLPSCCRPATRIPARHPHSTTPYL